MAPAFSPPGSPLPQNAGVRDLKSRFEALAAASTQPKPAPPTPKPPKPPAPIPRLALAAPHDGLLGLGLDVGPPEPPATPTTTRLPPPPPPPSAPMRRRSVSTPPKNVGDPPAESQPARDLAPPRPPPRTQSAQDVPWSPTRASVHRLPSPKRYRPTTPYENRPAPPPSPRLASNAPPITAKRRPPPPPSLVPGGSRRGSRIGSGVLVNIEPPPSGGGSGDRDDGWRGSVSREPSPSPFEEGQLLPHSGGPPTPPPRHPSSAPPRPLSTELQQVSPVLDPFAPRSANNSIDFFALSHASDQGMPPPPPVPVRPVINGGPPMLPSRKPSLNVVPNLPSRLPSTNNSPPPPPPRPHILMPVPVRHDSRHHPDFFATSLPPGPPPPPLPGRVPPPSGPREWDPIHIGPPPPPPVRNVAPGAPIQPRRLPSKTSAQTAEDSDEEDDEPPGGSSGAAKPDDMPDATFANRKPPHLDPPRSLNLGGSFSAFAVRGRHLCAAHHAVRLYATLSGSAEPVSTAAPTQDVKITAMQFRGTSQGYRQTAPARHVWCGTKDGGLFVYDCEERRIVDCKNSLHAGSVVGMYRNKEGGMLSLDETGKCQIWAGGDDAKVQISAPTRAQRIADKTTWSAMLGHQLWTSSGPATAKSAGTLALRSPSIRIYDPDPVKAWTVTPRPLAVVDTLGPVGAVSAGAVIPSSGRDRVYLGHESGHVSVWTRPRGLSGPPGEEWSCTGVFKVSSFQITALEGVTRYLWAGYRSGMVYVYDVDVRPWKVMKVWKAHKEGVTRIIADPSLLWDQDVGKLHVVTTSTDGTVNLWDGFMGTDWLAIEMKKREPEFCTYRKIRVLVCSWNIDASRPTDLVGTADNLDFLSNVLTSTESPDVIVFGFQEMIDLENKKLTAKTVLLGGRKKKNPEKLSDSVSQAYRQWLDRLTAAVRVTMPAQDPYVVVHTENLVGLFSCVFVKSSERVSMRDVAITTVKTGMRGRYGNKGAIVARLVVDDSSICFINCHLAAGQKHVRQRNADLIDILEEKSAFPDPPLGSASNSLFPYVSGGNGTSVLDHEICFLQGDLNYRIDQKREDVIRAVASGEYLKLLDSDQLVKERSHNPAFRLRTFREAPITFWPTYKYDPGTDMYDSSEKNRIPAWCDRILYRTSSGPGVEEEGPAAVEPLSYRRYEVNVSDHRPISGAYDVRVKCVAPGLRRGIWQEVNNRWHVYEQDLKSAAIEYYAQL